MNNGKRIQEAKESYTRQTKDTKEETQVLLKKFYLILRHHFFYSFAFSRVSEWILNLFLRQQKIERSTVLGTELDNEVRTMVHFKVGFDLLASRIRLEQTNRDGKVLNFLLSNPVSASFGSRTSWHWVTDAKYTFPLNFLSNKNVLSSSIPLLSVSKMTLCPILSMSLPS